MERAIKLQSNVSLQPLTPGHAPAMFAWDSDPMIGGNIGLRTTPTLGKTREWIAKALSDDSVSASAIYSGTTHVGNVILDRIDRYLSTARLSIYIGELSARGTGVGTTALYLAAAAGFKTLKLNKIWLTVHAENAAAVKCYERLGFQREGLLRDEFKLNGRLIPALYMGLLKHDFDRIAVASA